MKRPSATRRAPDGLAPRLRRASSRELLDLVNAHLVSFSMGEVRQTLLNPHVTAEVIDELLVGRHLLSSYEFRRAVARHRRTPESAAMRFVPGLFWHDLLEITLDVRLRPTVRRVAEKYLVQRLPRLALGEKIALARRAPGGVVATLRHDPSVRVIRAVLENPRLTVSLLAPLAAESKSPRILDLLARDSRWGRRYEVRVALARNPAAPLRAVLPILPTLRRDDLLAVMADEDQPSLVRNRAREIVETAKYDPDAIDRAVGSEIDWVEL